MDGIEKLEDVLLRYVSNYGKRRSSRQKQNCCLYLQQLFQEELHYPVKFERMGNGAGRVAVCVAGDLKRAEHVLIVPLDTPRRTCLPGYRYYPLDDDKAKKTELTAYALDTLLGIICFGAGLTILWMLTRKLLPALVVGWICFLLYALTRSNFCNFTKSSASMALVTHMAMRQADTFTGKQYAYVFVDRCSESRAGLDMFLKRYEEDLRYKKQILFLDCLADGEKIFAASSGRQLELPGLEEEVYRPAADHTLLLSEHPELTLLMTGEEENQVWSVKNLRSGKDRKVNMKRLKKLEEALLRL